jgi:hypothetical protein
VCRDFLRNRGVPSSEMTPEELLSEIWQKLLGTVPTSSGDTVELYSNDLAQVSIDPDVPERDGRVVWLIEQIGGSMAMAHRREDILRRRFGRASGGSGRPLVQPHDDAMFTDIVSDADAASSLEAGDQRRVWRGLLAMVELEFEPGDDHGHRQSAEHPLPAPRMDERPRGQRKKAFDELDQAPQAQERSRRRGP